MPLAAVPKSSTAISAATLDPGPARVAYGPVSSVSTPILTIPSEIWAWAWVAARLSTVKSVTKAHSDDGGRWFGHADGPLSSASVASGLHAVHRVVRLRP